MCDKKADTKLEKEALDYALLVGEAATERSWSKMYYFAGKLRDAIDGWDIE